MDSAAYLDHLAREGAAFAAAAEGNLDRPVPTCPGWDLAALVAHLGQVHGWVREVLAAAGEPYRGSRPDPPADRSELVGWYRRQVEDLVDDLRSRDPEAPAWVFTRAGTPTAGWWRRRQALETAVHRFDAQNATGAAGPVPADLAAEGVDEMLTELLPTMVSRRPVEGLTGTVHLHATDIPEGAPGEWWLDFDAEGLDARREHAKAGTALRGPASGLYLWVWNRQTPQEAGLEVLGESALVDTWRSITL
ncbi:MAG: maleylpyruvate isomerase family mycothiol-dependent enzyme [Acidimicrobiales bacterium]